MIQSIHTFRENLRTFRELTNRDEVLSALHHSAERVAVHDLHLAAYLDMCYPAQRSTLFSFSRTYDINSDTSYYLYLCGRRYIETELPDAASLLTGLFSKLDYGYQVRGIDPLATAGRVEITKRPLPVPVDGLRCPTQPPMVYLPSASPNQ